MKKGTIGKIFTIVVLLITALTMSKLFTKTSFGADNEERAIIEGNLDKYINYELSDDNKGTLVQYSLRTGIEYGDEFFAIKNSTLNVNLNQIDGKYPYDVKVIAKSTKVTNGKTSDIDVNYNYDSNSGNLAINVSNENENGEPIYNTRPSENDRDEFVIISYYDTYSQEKATRELSCGVSYNAALFTEDNRQVSIQGALTKEVTDDFGDLTSVSTTTSDVYNGYIKSNIINGTTYDTEYTEDNEILISNKEAHQKIYLTEENTFVNTNDIYYKSTKILKEDFLNVLGENGKIEILDGNSNVISSVDNNTFDENEEAIITYNDDVNKIIIKTSDILNEGILNIENVKKIKGDILNIEDKDITRKLIIVGANDKQVEVSDESNENNKTLKTVEEETYRAESENTIEVKDSQTSVDVNVDNTEWTNEKQNDVTFDVYLNSANESYNLFKNPTIRIELPSEVEKVVLGDSQVIYANGLTLTNTSVETGKNGNLNIVATLDGAQTQFSGNELKTDLKISTKIIIKKDIEDANEKINVAYTNQSTVNKKSEQGNIEKQIKIKAYNESKQENINGENIETLPNDNQTLGDKLEEVAKQQIRENVMPTATQSEIEGLNVTVNTTRGEDELNNGDIVYEGEFIKYSVQITNTTGSDINNVKIQASIPDGLTYGELEADYYSDRGNYQYNFENDTREKEINVGTIKAGETITKFYEVKVNDLADSENEKQVTSNIKTFIGNTQVNSYELSNTVKPAEVSGFLSAYLSGMKDRWAYELKVNNPENKEVTVKVTLPKYYQFEGIAYQWQYYPEDKIKVDGNVIEFTVNDSEPYTILGNMDSSQVKQDFDTSKVELKAYATLSIDGEEYKTNENRILFEFESVAVEMTSDNEGEKVNYGDPINYHIAITNTGRTNYHDENNSELYNVISVRLTDYLPENVNPVSVTYEKYEIADEETGALASEKTIKTEDISGEVTDENGNKLPNVDLSFTIPYGETINVYIQTTAGYVYEETNVQNSVTVQSDMVKTQTSNIITHTILPENNVERDTTPPTITGVEDGKTYNNYVTPIAQDENLASVTLIKDGKVVEGYQNGSQIRENGSYTLTASDEAGNSTQVRFIIDTQGGGEEPGGNPNQPQEGGYSIKGVVWEDQNGDGSRQSSEQLINGIEVMLVNLSDSSRVKANTRTTNGQYSFQNLEQGQYVVVFRYDTSNYKITDYKKTGVSESLNSDAINQTITLDGESVEAGVTDILNLSQNLDNIDIGLIGIQQQNLKIDKYISNITLQTNVRTNQYTYENSKLAKIDVRAKEIQGAVVTVTYNIVVTNQGKNATTVDEIIDYVPEGLSFTQQGNTNWTQESGNQVVNRSLSNQNIAPGESKQVTLTLTKTLNENGTGTFTNRAEINVDDVSKDDNSSSADLIISVSTGAIVYIGFGMLGLVILIGIMFLLVKFKVLNIRKIGKLSLFLVIFGAMILSQVQYVCAFDKHTTFINIGNQSPDFSGGPYNAGGKCIDGGIWAYSGSYTAFNGSYWVTRWENVTNRDDISINLRKLNDQIGLKKLGSDYLVGPFQVECSYNGGYDFWAYDRNGNEIQPGVRKTTTDENGNFKWVGGSATFYLKFSANDLKNGISRIKMSTTRTGNERVTHYAWGFGHYDYDGVPAESGQAQRVVPNHEQRFNFGDEGNFSYETNTTISNTASVEWTNFNSTLDITKVDYDNSNVKIEIEGTLTKNDGSYSKHFATTNGQVHFDNLTPGLYTIKETVNNNYGYEEEIGKEIQVNVGTGTLLQVNMQNIKHTGNLKIVKQDYDTKKVLAGVSFKIRNSKGQYVVAVDDNGNTQSKVTGTIHLGNMKFTSSENQATEFITDSNGEINIYNMLVDTYTITETAINTVDYGYELDANYIFWINGQTNGKGPSTTVQLSRQTSDNTVDSSSDKNNLITYQNRKKYFRLSGRVWEDMIDGKTSSRDSVYDSDVDKNVANVTVKLKDRNGNIVSFKTAQGETLDEILTNSDGYYEMWDILIDNIDDYYIEFTYNGMSYTNVPIDNILDANASKAIENADDRSEFNEKFAEITYDQGTTGQAKNTQGEDTYKLTYDEGDYSSTLNYGPNSVYGYEGQRFPVNNTEEQYIITSNTRDAYLSKGNNYTGYLSDIYTAEQIRGNEQEEPVEEIKNINLGLLEREQPDLALVEDVDNAKVTLNGYEHTYRYSQRFENPGTFNESTGLEGGEDGFNVAVKFGNKYGSQSYTREIYSSDISYNMQDGNQGKLGVYITYKISIRNEATTLRTRANEIVNYFDERYDINSITTEDGQELEYSVDNSYNSNGYRRVFINNEETLKAQSQEIIYIEYKLQNDAVNAVLNEDITLNSVTEITSYSSFSDDNFTPYGGVDKDSRPGSAEPQTRTTYEDDTDRAPSFVLTVKEGRMIKGTVWEDNAREELLEDTDVGFDRERKGDGLYTTGENKIGNVLVELLNIEGDSYSVATLYKFDSSTNTTYTENASMYTSSLGDYEFSGVIPGNYLIRYTYGSQSVIYDSNGNRITNVEISNYKSTIYRGGDKAAAEAMTDYWYRAETGDAQRLSDAKDELGINEDGSTFDIVNDRTTEEEINYGTSLENDKLEKIQANTRRFDIKLDYDVNLDNISQYGADLKFVFDNIDLGIIRRPIQDLIITKEISHVQVVLANGQVIIDGDPREGNLQYVRFLPDGNIHIEIDSELLQGATINITYTITVDNTRAEIDYNNEDYYIYGIIPNNNAGWKLATVTRLLDYLSNGLTYDEVANSGLWEEFKLDGSMVGTYFSEEAYNALKKYNRIFQTDEFATMEPGQIKSVELKASRVLSNNAEDFNFDNDIEVNTLKDKKIDNSTPGNYVPGDSTTYEDDDDTVNIVITGPTGENRNYLPYVLLGISSFIIIAAGVIFIKKKVL